MTKRRFKIQDSDTIERCPKCDNHTEFTAMSEQIQEDGCEVWVKCKCGHDPFDWRDKLESVMGGVDDDNCRQALGCWNEVILENVHNLATTKNKLL